MPPFYAFAGTVQPPADPGPSQSQRDACAPVEGVTIMMHLPLPDAASRGPETF